MEWRLLPNCLMVACTPPCQMVELDSQRSAATLRVVRERVPCYLRACPCRDHTPRVRQVLDIIVGGRIDLSIVESHDLETFQRCTFVQILVFDG